MLDISRRALPSRTSRHSQCSPMRLCWSGCLRPAVGLLKSAGLDFLRSDASTLCVSAAPATELVDVEVELAESFLDELEDAAEPSRWQIPEGVTIRVDYHENKLIPFFRSEKVHISVERLKVGDVIVEGRDLPPVFIERKTVNDLLASVKDKRLYNQLWRQRDASSGDRARSILIVEGHFSSHAQTLRSTRGSDDFSKGFFRNDLILRTLLVRLAIAHELPVIRTASELDTCRTILAIARKYPELHTWRPCRFKAQQLPARKAGDDLKTTLINQLCCIRGVTADTASHLVKPHRHMGDFVSELSKQLDPVLWLMDRGGSRKLSRPAALRVVAALCGETALSTVRFADRLAAVKGITKASAATLARQFRDEDSLRAALSCDHSDIGEPVGKAVALGLRKPAARALVAELLGQAAVADDRAAVETKKDKIQGLSCAHLL